jgi:hypothetical protein
MQEVNHEKGVKSLLAHDGRRWGQAILAQQHWHESAAVAESRAGRPCSVGIRSERVEAVEGAAGCTTWIAVVGLADETSERGRLCGVSLVRSSRRQPSTTACPGGDDLPQGGGAACTGCVAAPTKERTLEIVTCETENGL